MNDGRGRTQPTIRCGSDGWSNMQQETPKEIYGDMSPALSVCTKLHAA